MEEGTGEHFDISDVLRVTNDKRLRKSHGSMKTGKTPAQEVQSVNETVPIHVQRSAERYANLAKQDPGRGRQNR